MDILVPQLEVGGVLVPFAVEVEGVVGFVGVGRGEDVAEVAHIELEGVDLPSLIHPHISQPLLKGKQHRILDLSHREDLLQPSSIFIKGDIALGTADRMVINLESVKHFQTSVLVVVQGVGPPGIQVVYLDVPVLVGDGGVGGEVL